MDPPPSVALVTLGCAKNLVDSEVMAGCLRQAGCAFEIDPDRADVILINTCGFIGPARAEAEAEISRAVDRKRRRPGLRIVVVGCYVERDRETLARRFPEVDAWSGVRSFDRVADLIAGGPVRERRRTFLYGHATPRIVTTPRGWAYLKISEGCSRRCAFCAIPLIKGPYRSRSAASIAAEAARLAADGAREIVLISQDSTYYGRDRGAKDGLPRLLRRLEKIDALAWIRVLYGYPEGVTSELLDALAGGKLCRYLDLPFQHADPALVKAMGRGMDGPRALRLIERIRRRLPGAALRTSLIVGFPGEGRREFRAVLDFVREARFDHLGVFTYSPEAGTAAAALRDRTRAAVKEGRRAEIMALQAEISLAHNRARVGTAVEVLVEGRLRADPRVWVGRGRFQAPEVDGAVLFEAPAARGDLGGSLQTVEITAAERYDLRGSRRT